MPFESLKARLNFRSETPSTPASSHGESQASRESQLSIGPSSATSGDATSDSFHVTRIDDSLRYRAVIQYLYAKLTANQWLPPTTPQNDQCSGLLLRKCRDTYICEPERVCSDLLEAVRKLNVDVAFTMSTETTNVILNALQPHQTELSLPSGELVQIVPSLREVASSYHAVKKFQYAALITEERLLLVWHDEVDKILHHAAAVEEKLLSLIWGTSKPLFISPRDTSITTPSTGTASSSMLYLSSNFKEAVPTMGTVDPIFDEETGDMSESLDRPLALISAVYVGIALCLIIFLLLGVGVSKILYEILMDGNYIRLALLSTIPVFLLFSIFFMIVVFGNLFQVFGPTKNIATNTRYHSAIKPNLSTAYARGFVPPRITIQMPVYTESLQAVIIPTITSLKAAISHYELHGGSASIFINDDGFAYMSEDQQRERTNFYQDNNIAWVARPKNNSECGYVRKGKFKKASNMNFALNVSTKVERRILDMMSATELDGRSIFVNTAEEAQYYQQALAEVLASYSWIKAEGDIRIGEHILIVDSDTKVPVDCLLYGAAEMFLSPEVAIVQHSTGVMQVSWDYFENGISFFTNLIYSAIRFAVGSGETAPFVGHNAFLRWKAIQSIGRPDDGYVAYWSESHVSEDFDVSLRLQIAGNIIRLASYHGEEFKEGVSLTIYDELARWEKYAYGCNELVFNPIRTWLWKGPFTKLFMTFMWSNLQLSSKITILGYISSYYALASGFPMSLLNYFLVGWFNGFLDKYYMDSWKVFLSLVIVFSLLGNVCLAIMRYRLGQKTFWSSLFENFKWLPLMAVFFGGLSFHLSVAILSHMFQVKVSWGTTCKEKEDSNFFKEVPKIVKSFKWMYAIMIPVVGGMIYLGCFAPDGWRISDIICTVPMAITLSCHLMLPLLLNPSLVVFNY